VNLRPREPRDSDAVDAFLRGWHARRVARLGELLEPLDYPALVCEEDGRLLGVLTYVVRGDRCEVLTLHASQQRRGVGTALIDGLERTVDCPTIWLVTTNDNVDALRFYQRRGFRLAELRPGGVDESRRRLKPEIPDIGFYGIPIRDELVLEKRFVP
jgi:ribosomal protein S18 acetylase RimI-like enzyme